MKWLLFLVATTVTLGAGGFVFLANAMSECSPHQANFQGCLADKRSDAALIVALAVVIWLGSALLIFRKSPHGRKSN